MGGKANCLHTVNLVFAQGQQGEKTLVLLVIFSVKIRS